jgi:hypothetical protein
LNGPLLESAVWEAERRFLEQPELFLAEVGKHAGRSEEAAIQARTTLQRLERRLTQNAGYRQRAYDGFVRGLTDEETYHRVMAGYRAEESWLTQELERERRHLALAEQAALSVASVNELYGVLAERLSTATPGDKRFVLECLGTRILVQPEGISVGLSVPEQVLETVGSIPP